MSSLLRMMYRGESRFDFIGRSKAVAIASAIVIVVCVLSLLTRGLNLGIEFEGGIVWEVPRGELSEDNVRGVLDNFGLGDARVQLVTGQTDIFRIKGEAEDIAKQAEVTQALADRAGVGTNEIGLSEVGPSWGDEITNKARRALIFFFIVIAFYIGLRFEWKMAAAALVAVVHDIIFSVGVYSILQFEVTPATVIAFLTIMGYSLYDTIVVFDKLRDNTLLLSARGRTTYRDVVNVSLNQVLMRSINTSITSILPVLSLLLVGSLLLGATTLQEFGVALLVGMLAGSYSSLFVASPLVVWLKSRETHWAHVETQAASRDDSVASAADALAATGYQRKTPPRPRKRDRRQR